MGGRGLWFWVGLAVGFVLAAMVFFLFAGLLLKGVKNWECEGTQVACDAARATADSTLRAVAMNLVWVGGIFAFLGVVALVGATFIPHRMEISSEYES